MHFYEIVGNVQHQISGTNNEVFFEQKDFTLFIFKKQSNTSLESYRLILLFKIIKSHKHGLPKRILSAQASIKKQSP